MTSSKRFSHAKVRRAFKQAREEKRWAGAHYQPESREEWLRRRQEEDFEEYVERHAPSQ